MTGRSPLDPVFAQAGPIPVAFQDQFLAHPERDYRVVLEGTMHEIAYRPRWLKPLFLALGCVGVLVPKCGKEIPTTLEVVPGYLPNGEPYHEWNRTFSFPRPIFFNTKVVYDHQLKNIADVVGIGKFLHMVWDAKFTPPDTFTLDTIANAVNILGRPRYMPAFLWKILLGRVKFIQKADLNAPGQVTVDLRILHPWFGEVFLYRGSFRVVRYPK
jgi:hypothetical protein